jgi:nucleoside-diphosphate-sugar epimerase
MNDFLTWKSEDNSSVLVTGATGALGPRVVEALHRSGYSVRVLDLDPPAPGAFGSSVDFRLGDIKILKDIRSAIKDVHLVVHMAAIPHVANPPHDRSPLYALVNVDGTKNVVEMALKAGVKRFVFFSTIAVYGNSAGRTVLNEDTIPKPETLYAQSKSHAERIVLDAYRPDGVPLGSVLRLAAAYGSQVKGNYRRLLQALAGKRFIPIGPGTNRRTLVYDKDVARAVLAVIANPNAAGKVFNVTDGEIHSLNDIIQSMCGALGRRPPRIHLPVAPSRMAADIIDKGTMLLGLGFPGLRSALDKYTEDIAVDGHRIQNEIGFRPKYDLLSGWEEAIEEMRARGDL